MCGLAGSRLRPTCSWEIRLDARASAFALFVGVAVLSGCSSSQNSPTAGASTTAPAVSETTVPSAAVSAPAPVASTAGEVARGTEPDGASYGLLTALTADRVLSYDKVDFLPAACERRTEGEVGDPEATSRICFRNVNPLIRTVTVSPDVIIGNYVPDGSVSEQTESDYDGLRRSFNNSRSSCPFGSRCQAAS